jgi:hypothetical protein
VGFVFFFFFLVFAAGSPKFAAEYDRTHPSAVERTRGQLARLRATTAKQTHRRTAGGHSNAEARRSNVDHDRSHALTIDRICDRTHNSAIERRVADRS